MEWLPSNTNVIPDPTIRFLALSTIGPSGSFLEPKEVTNPIAALEYCMRLVYLVEMHQRIGKNKDQISVEAEALSRWFIEKHESTFNSLRALTHRASALAKYADVVPRVWWLDRKDFQIMSYLGNTIKINKFPAMLSKMEDDLIHIWENDVLLGLGLRVNYQTLHDDITNKTPGYSFLDHPKNKGLKTQDLLMKAIIQDPHLSKLYLCPQSGPDGKPLWNVLNLRAWLFNYSQFSTVLISRIEMTAGSPARGTEVSCLQYRNTMERQGRGLHIMGDYVATLCRYHKSQSNTTYDKLIPHAVDAVCSDLIIQDLSIARPFAELAAFICFPDKPMFQTLYRTFLFVNNGHLFTTPQVTACLKKYTGLGLEYEAGVNAWRHISIAFRRKLAPKLLNLVEEADAETPAALQAAHSVQTENRVYGISGDSTITGSHTLMEEFVDASIEWQILLKTMPGGLKLPYSQVRATEFPEFIKREIAEREKEKRKAIAPEMNMLSDMVVEKLKPTLQSANVDVEALISGLLHILKKMVDTSVKEAFGKPSSPLKEDIPELWGVL